MGPDAWIEAAAISPDGRTIVTKQDFSLRIRDAATGNELRKIELPRSMSWSSNGVLAFTPDGKAIAVTSQGAVIHLIDFESGKTIRDFSNENPESGLGPGWTSVLGIAFSADGKLMASGGFVNDKHNYFARLWDVETGKELRRFMHGKSSYGIESLAFSPDGKMLVTGAHDARVRLFDVESGKELRTFPNDGRSRMSGGCVAFAPDGKTVAAARESLRLYDVASGEERWHIDRTQARNLQFTDGGKTLMAAVSGAIYRWDTATGKSLIPEAADCSVAQILVTPDGSRVVTRGQDGEAHIWDGANGKHLRRFQTGGWQCGLAMSPDGRFLAWPVDDSSVQFTVPQDPSSRYDGSRIRLYDIAADKYVDRFPAFKGAAKDLAFTNDGKKLVTVDSYGSMVRIWNFETAMEERSFEAIPEAVKKQSYYLTRTLLSPDGKTVAKVYEEDRGGRLGMRTSAHLVRLWDVATGKELPQLNGNLTYVLHMAFSPDGRFFVTAGETTDRINRIDQVFVWETATGSRVAALPDGLPIVASAVAFSRDSRLLATALPEGAIRLWEVATWTKRNEFKGHRDRPTTLAFAPGGQLLSGSLDTTVLAWDIRPPRVSKIAKRRGESAERSSAELEADWKELGGDAAKGYAALGRLISSPKQAVSFLGKHLQSAKPADTKRIEQLIGNLNDARFQVRELASKELEALGEFAVPLLQKALAGNPALEVKRRLDTLLDRLDGARPSAETVRQIRAVEALESIGNPEALRLLEKLAAGPPEMRLTQEALASARRLAKRSSDGP